MFPNLYTILKISITLPVGSVETKRSFSKLKFIKNRLRSTMDYNRSESLIRISCEQDIDLDYSTIISIFSQKCPSLIKNLT